MIKTKLVNCPECKGTGDNPVPTISGTPKDRCTCCRGSGSIQVDIEPEPQAVHNPDSNYREDRHDKDFDEDI